LISFYIINNITLDGGRATGEKVTATWIYGGELIKRDPREVKEHITGIDIGYPAERKDIIRFAEGKQAESDVLDLLRGIPEIEYNTPEEVVREIERLESQRTREYIRSDTETTE
jgi:hypothetical protein